ncbi:unnamed protein product [Calicophoron daubneyi]|uniref:RING-type domain-containing protein n=1 Tax=Calicophoron daubneyi TaxID=300641 RepID=A0AAV2T929_CALDB
MVTFGITRSKGLSIRSPEITSEIIEDTSNYTGISKNKNANLSSFGVASNETSTWLPSEVELTNETRYTLLKTTPQQSVKWIPQDTGAHLVYEVVTPPTDNSSGPDEPLLNRSSVLFVAVSFILLMVISLAWLVFYYVQRFRYLHSKERVSRRLAELAKKAVARIPLKTLHSGDRETNSEFDQCAICIEHFRAMDNIRILPCRHYFHKLCVDPWLLEQRSCPMCKLDILQAYGLRADLYFENLVTTGQTSALTNPSASGLASSAGSDDGMERIALVHSNSLNTLVGTSGPSLTYVVLTTAVQPSQSADPYVTGIYRFPSQTEVNAMNFQAGMHMPLNPTQVQATVADPSVPTFLPVASCLGDEHMNLIAHECSSSPNSHTESPTRTKECPASAGSASSCRTTQFNVRTIHSDPLPATVCRLNGSDIASTTQILNAPMCCIHHNTENVGNPPVSSTCEPKIGDQATIPSNEHEEACKLLPDKKVDDPDEGCLHPPQKTSPCLTSQRGNARRSSQCHLPLHAQSSEFPERSNDGSFRLQEAVTSSLLASQPIVYRGVRRVTHPRNSHSLSCLTFLPSSESVTKPRDPEHFVRVSTAVVETIPTRSLSVRRSSTAAAYIPNSDCTHEV